MDTLMKRYESTLAHGVLVEGNGGSGTIQKKSGLISVAIGKDTTAGAVMYGDNYAIRGFGSDTYASASYAHGTLAMAGSDNISAASAKMITNSTGIGLLEESAASPANALIGRDFNSIDFRTMQLPDGAWFGGIRNGMEAFAAVGDNRAYKNGDDVWVMSSGTGRAGVNGNQVWASNEGFEVTARLCACTDDQRGKDCYCACHRGQVRHH